MVEFRPFRAEHLRYLRPQAVQRQDHAVLASSDYGDIAQKHFSLSAWDGHRCVAAAGMVPVFAHRAVVWAILSEEAAPHLLSIVRKMRGALDLSPFKRVEMTVRVGFEPGHRLARLMGMKLETPEPLRSYGAFDEDEMLYARIR